ncbi:MAG: pilus assembly protein CpaE [Nocardioidaceae bacterium]
MITLDQATRLRRAGVLWVPSAGDRFVVPDRDMDEDVFVVSDMTVEVHDYPGGKVIGFNGTTEWALDSIEQREVVWLPRENQLRQLLANRFVRLEADEDGFAVDLSYDGEVRRYTGQDAEQAYAEALLGLLGG